MKRLVLKSLEKWQRGKSGVPLLVRGARQVGKTWLIREHANSYPSFVEINLESHPEYHPSFQELFGKPQKLISALGLLAGKKIIPGETLLFLDEIQECPEAILSLRYFKEDLPTLRVVAAGSLLEFTIKELSFPVGRIDFIHLFPLNFEEYLDALGRADLVEAITAADESHPLPTSIHELLLIEAAQYGLLGGMPEVVKSYVETHDLQDAQAVQQRLIANFREDFYKYAPRAKVDLLRKLFEGIPRLLGQKFKYANIDREVRSRELGTALELLIEAGLAYKVFHSSAQGLPLAAQTKESLFKVFFLDVGLAERLLGLNLSQLFLEKKGLLANRGGIAEQFVAQELLSYTKENDSPKLHYWHRESRSSEAEVDFVIEQGSYVMPVEVKSDKGQKTKSLRLFMEERKEYVQQALKVSSENFQRHDSILIYPFYALSKFAAQAVIKS